MSIDILRMHHFQQNERSVDIALPVIAIECEATPPLENYLDAYEETVLKLVAIGLASHGISSTLNATESLVEEIMDSLVRKGYLNKETGKPWIVTEDGRKYLHGNVEDRASTNSQYGYMFINAIKRDVLPYFYQGDINQIPLYRGSSLPAKLTANGDEQKTFIDSAIKQTALRTAYKKYFKNTDASKQFCDGEITFEEAADLFEGLDSFDEEDYEPTTLEEAEQARSELLKDNMFIRALKRPPKHVYLTMRIIIDPQIPGGYHVESPFDFNGLDNSYFLRQIQWMVASGNTYIGNESLKTFLSREIVKICPQYRETELDFSVFVQHKIPLLGLLRDRFSNVYDDMSRIYSLMQRQSTLIDKENIVNNLARYIVESLFNSFFKGITKETLGSIQNSATTEIKDRGIKSFMLQAFKGTALDPNKIHWNQKYALGSIGRITSTRGNSIIEKFINMVVINYYLGTENIKAFLSSPDVQQMYELADNLNQIRRKVSHDTDERFDHNDYDYYVAHVFTLVNSILEIYRRNEK